MINLLGRIKSGTLTNWENKLIGEFKITEDGTCLRFNECEEVNNNIIYKHNKYSDWPIIAKGFVPYFIYHYEELSTIDICNEYCFSNIQNSKKEQEDIEYSINNLYPYISENEKEIINDAIIWYNKILNQPKLRINNNWFQEIDTAIRNSETRTLLRIGNQINSIINAYNFEKAVDYYRNDTTINVEIDRLNKLKDYYTKCFQYYNDFPEYSKLVDFIASLVRLQNKTEYNQDEPLTKDLTPKMQKKLFDLLIEKKFISKNTNYEHFCFVFGNTPIPEGKKPFKPIKWKRCKQTLRMLLFCDAIKNGELKACQIKKITPNFFTKDGIPVELASDRKKDNTTNIIAMKHLLKSFPTA